MDKGGSELPYRAQCVRHRGGSRLGPHLGGYRKNNLGLGKKDRCAMTVEGALEFVAKEIERIEFENAGKELRPWERDACPAAKEHWHRVQQRIWLETKGKRGPKECCEELDLPSWPQSAESQKNWQRSRQKRWGGVNPP